MNHHLVNIESFEIIGPFSLQIVFSDRKVQQIDFLPVLRGEIYGPLRSQDLFNQVRIDPEIKTIVWPNGADFDPALLYEWGEVKNELYERAQQWEASDKESFAS